MAIKITREEYQRKFGVPPPIAPKATTTQPQVQPKQNKSFLEKAEGIANIASFGIGKKTGQAIGTGLAAGVNKLTDLGSRARGFFTGEKPTDLYKNTDLSAPKPLQVGADVAAGALTVAGFKGLKPGPSLLRTVAKETALDAGAGASLAVANEKSGKDIAKDAAIWGATAGLLPVAGAVGGKVASKFGKEARGLKATEKVTDMITPKPTIKQAQLAQSEGRLIEGKQPTLFRAGTDDKVLPSKRTIAARDTIMQKIPNAAKLKPTELYKAVDTEITNTANTLKPKMKATPVKPETTQKINMDWENTKKAQLEAADATEEANIIKLQNQFEAKLKKSGSGSHDDLWETRVEYDKSIPENVKKANSLSPESLQNKKEIWLQNRQILTDAINDNAHGMGETSRKAFEEMANLYEARNSLLTKSKIDKAKMSKINQYLSDHPQVAQVLGGATLYGVLKNFGVPLP